MKPYPYPLPESALEDFCSPRPENVFGQACRHEGEIWAGNGYVAIRAARGRWIDAEFPEASPAFLERVMALPWDRPLVGPWRALEDAREPILRRGSLALWAGHRLAPSPIWRVGASICRLALIRLIWRLPRCEVFLGPVDSAEPLFFRFSGGHGLIAHDPRLTLWSFHLWPPQTDCLSGELVPARGAPAPTLRRFSLPNWPPADPVDD